MKNILFPILFAGLMAACNVSQAPEEQKLPEKGPISLHPLNPHYFLYKGRPLALITSGEHYGAVLNLDFDYRTYLKTLSGQGMNYTRIFTGTYFEIEGQSFGIQHNTLAPRKTRIVTPWSMVVDSRTGTWKYDLSTWNQAYFERLKDFMTLADSCDIIVEVTLFSSIYREEHWDQCPLNPANNINITGDVSRFEAHTLANGDLLSYQVSFVQKMVRELNAFDNFFFELQNEPWSDHAVAVYNIVNKEDLQVNDWTYKADFASEASLAWQDKIASVIVEEERNLGKKHLIAQNYTNYKAPVPDVNPQISIINFHYAWPEAVEWNYHYNRVIGFDESGFAGSGDQVYRRQAWQFMLSGGGLFNNLDYSFYVGHEDGLGKNQAPGGGSQALRFQLKILSEFLHGFNLTDLHPDCTCVRASSGLIPYILSDPERTYAVYLRAIGTDSTFIQLETGEGGFQVQRVNTLTGSYSEPELVLARDGLITLELDMPDGELALRITRE